MGFEVFNELEILQKSLNLVFIIISLVIGFLIIYKYFQYKSTVFITVGLAWVFMSSSWWPISINFILIGFFDVSLPSFWYLFIERAFIMPALIFWFYSFTELAVVSYKKEIRYTSIIFFIVLEIITISILITYPELIGSPIPEKPYEYSHTTLNLSIDLIALVLVLITGILFSRQSMMSENIKIKWKGRFLLISFISFTIGSIMNGLLHIVIPMNAVSIILIRIILISSAIEYYLGFFLPDVVLKYLK